MAFIALLLILFYIVVAHTVLVIKALSRLHNTSFFLHKIVDKSLKCTTKNGPDRGLRGGDSLLKVHLTILQDKMDPR